MAFRQNIPLRHVTKRLMRKTGLNDPNLYQYHPKLKLRFLRHNASLNQNYNPNCNPTDNPKSDPNRVNITYFMFMELIFNFINII